MIVKMAQESLGAAMKPNGHPAQPYVAATLPTKALKGSSAALSSYIQALRGDNK